MAAVLGVNSTRVNTYLPGLRVPQRTLERLGHLPKVLYVDTEMEKLELSEGSEARALVVRLANGFAVRAFCGAVAAFRD